MKGLEKLLPEVSTNAESINENNDEIKLTRGSLLLMNPL